MRSGAPAFGIPFARRLGALLLALLPLLVGCRSNSQELLEAELRDREQKLDELKKQIDHKDGEILGLEAEVDRLERRVTKGSKEPLGSLLLVRKITLGRGTGGFDENPKVPGDEALQIVVEPRDNDDQSVKAPGALHIDLFEITPQGLEFLLSTWDISAKELRSKWDTPLIGGPAYRVKLPWQALPNSDHLRVVVVFTTPEGQKFQADAKFTVRLPDRPKGPAREKDPQPLSAPPNDEPLHMPRNVVPPPDASTLEPPTPDTPAAAPANGSSGGLRPPQGARRVTFP